MFLPMALAVIRAATGTPAFRSPPRCAFCATSGAGKRISSRGPVTRSVGRDEVKEFPRDLN
jgi:hypothetical protein